MEHRGSLLDYPNQLVPMLGTNSPIILEIGCNDGSDSYRFIQLFPRISLYCFEPDPRAVLEWEKKNLPQYLEEGGSCHLLNVALSDQSGKAKFYQSSGKKPKVLKRDWDLSGSINVPTGHLEFSPWIKFSSTIEVETMTLDEFYGHYLADRVIDLVWMDVQGAERKVIEGGEWALSNTKFFYTEFGHWKKPLYEGQMTANETQNFLEPDWECLGIYEGCNLLMANKKYGE
jgi:FkbM family methyltransferase